jgi:aspartyl-tRNA(Asn)/glutamyl-tRNA(Gln) amidotransferase subunit A
MSAGECIASATRCLAAIAAPDGEGSRTFTQVYSESTLNAAMEADRRYRQGSALSPVDGTVVAVKDLFDVRGEITWAGSVALRNEPPAIADALSVARLRLGGAIIIGKTNMTEFAYSGLGLNPHFGTPANPFERALLRRIPGGSSSGAAVAVADGMADTALGTDTGGSVRIPAALCGLVGWKPTARRISLAGVWPLAPTFDSVGVIANCVGACATADAVLAATTTTATATAPSHLRLGRVRGYIENDLEPAVARAYERALERLADSGVQIIDAVVPEFERVRREHIGVTMTTYEAFRTHMELLERFGEQYDPRVRTRLELGRNITPAQYATAASARAQVQHAAARALQSFDAWLLPTVTRVAPSFDAVESDEGYLATNRAMLRNASLINLLDGCAISLPCQERGEAPVGLSIAGLGLRDADVLAIAQTVETIISHCRIMPTPD